MIFLVVGVTLFGYLLWFNTYCQLKDLKIRISLAIVDVEKAMPRATHSVRTEVLNILGRLKC